MNLKTEQDGAFLVLQLSGNLDAFAVQEIRQDIENLMQSSGQTFLVDGSHIGLIDSSGIGYLVHLFKTAQGQGDRLALVGLNGQADDMMRFLKIDQVVPYFADLKQAKEQLLEG